MRTPTVTPVQMFAAIPAVAALLRTFGVLTLDRDRQDALSDALRFSSALVIADAVVRAGRSVGFGRHLDAVAETPQWPEPVIGDDVEDDIAAIALDDETGEPIVERTPPLVPAE